MEAIFLFASSYHDKKSHRYIRRYLTLNYSHASTFFGISKVGLLPSP